MRYALRRLLHDRVFAAVAIVTLGLGIGANTAIFSLIRTVLLQPLPYGNPGELVLVWDTTRKSGITNLSASEIKGYGAVEGLMFGGYIESNANVTGGQEPERLRTAWITWDLFEILRVPATEGRTFRNADVAADNSVVIGHGLWMRRYGGSTGVIGQPIEVNGRQRILIGVMPEGFKLPLDFRADRPTEAWMPISLDNPGLTGWGNRSFVGVGRITDGRSTAVMTSQLHAMSDAWLSAGYVHDADGGLRRRAAILVSEVLSGGARRPLLLVFAAVAVVLLIAIANVVNLLLARADRRRQETAIRSALGAGRGDLVRLMLAESMTLSFAGALFGLAVAWSGLRVLSLLQPANLPRAAEASLDPIVLLFATALAIAAGVIFGIVPAVMLSRSRIASTLHDSGRSGTPSRARHVLRGSLVVAQIAMSVVLVLGAGLVARTLIALTRIDPGFETANILTAQLVLPNATYPRGEDVNRMYRQTVERLEQVPGIVKAGGIRIIPLTRPMGDYSITIEGQVHNPDENPNGDFQWVIPGYFEVLGLRMIEGRPLTAQDREDTMPVVVINDTMAARYWPGERAIGRRFKMGTGDTPYMTIVGVVATSRHNTIVEAPRAEMFLPHAQLLQSVGGASRTMALVMKTAGSPLAMVDRVKAVVRELDPNLPLADIQTMDTVMGRALSQPRFTSLLLLTFAALALMLAAVGIYGTVSLLVAERTREIGIRMALGAARRSVVGMVLGRSLVLAAIGIAAGVAAGAAITPLVGSLLYGVKPFDPLTFAVVPAILLCVTIAATFAPARRASKVDPAIALRF